MDATKSSAGWRHLCFQKGFGSLTAMFNKYEAYLSSYINDGYSAEKYNNLLRGFADLSDRLSSRLLNNHSPLSPFRDTRATTQLDYSRAHDLVQEFRS